MADAITAASLMESVRVDAGRWDRMPSEKEIEAAVSAIRDRGITVAVAEDAGQALELVKGMIPAGAEVMNGSSTTLIEIGFIDYLEKGQHGWKNLHQRVFAENDQAKRADLRRKAQTADYFLASVNAIAGSGELVACDQGGSRVGAFPFAAKNLILVSGVNKIVPTLDDAFERIRLFALPLEDARMKKLYNTGSSLGKFVIIAKERPGRTTLVLVKERLGY